MNHRSFGFFVRAKRSAFVIGLVSVVVFASSATAFAQSTSATASMSLSEMNTLIDSLLAIVESLTKQIADVAVSPATTASVVDTATVEQQSSPVEAISAVIGNGSISPASFNLLSSEQKSLFITASDAGYTFEIPENGTSVAIEQGATAEIPLGVLGSGVHMFSCGANCTGTISIGSEDD